MIRRELLRFALVGIAAVALAYVIYRGLLLLGVSVNMANGIAYVVGTMLSFVANKTWTFLNDASISHSIGKFVVLHVGSLLANILVNATALSLLINKLYSVELAFLSGIAVSTVVNFIGMKFFVFPAHEFS